MLIHLAARLGAMALTLLLVTAVTFVALAAIPGDAAGALVGDTASTAQLATLRADMGLDQPLPVRYARFVGDLARGDLGRSLVTRTSVGELLAARLPYTLLLAAAALLLAVALGGVAGVAAAVRAGSLADTLLMGGAALGLAIPTFWSALLLMLLFGVRLHWLPVSGADTALHLILPAFVLALPTAAMLARQLRASLLDVLHADYIRTAHGKGLAPGRVLSRHILRNSLLPVVTVLGLYAGHLLGGAFLVETIFGWPGLGRLTVQAIFDRDYPVVLGAALLIASFYLLCNLIVDLVHARLDPQVGFAAV